MRTRWLTLALWATVVLLAVFTGSERNSWGDLNESLRTGSVREVTVVGALPPGAVGEATVRLQWSDNGHRHFAEVRQSTSAPTSSGEPAQVIGGVDAALRSQAPNVRIRHQEFRGGTQWSVYGWDVRWPAALAFVLPMALTYLLAVRGPAPRVATRTGWAVGILSPSAPLVVPLYLVFGARHSGSATPRSPIGGGWAFFLCWFALPGMLITPVV